MNNASTLKQKSYSAELEFDLNYLFIKLSSEALKNLQFNQSRNFDFHNNRETSRYEIFADALQKMNDYYTNANNTLQEFFEIEKNFRLDIRVEGVKVF
jgi:hypothetical protein